MTMYVLHSSGDNLNCNKLWLNLYFKWLLWVSVYSDIFASLYIHVLHFSKNPEDSPSSSPQKALALAYDGDMDMWAHYEYARLKHAQNRCLASFRPQNEHLQQRTSWAQQWARPEMMLTGWLMLKLRGYLDNLRKFSYSRNRMWHHVYSTIAWVCVYMSVCLCVCLCIRVRGSCLMPIMRK